MGPGELLRDRLHGSEKLAPVPHTEPLRERLDARALGALAGESGAGVHASAEEFRDGADDELLPFPPIEGPHMEKPNGRRGGARPLDECPFGNGVGHEADPLPGEPGSDDRFGRRLRDGEDAARGSVLEPPEGASSDLERDPSVDDEWNAARTAAPDRGSVTAGVVRVEEIGDEAGAGGAEVEKASGIGLAAAPDREHGKRRRGSPGRFRERGAGARGQGDPVTASEELAADPEGLPLTASELAAEIEKEDRHGLPVGKTSE